MSAFNDYGSNHSNVVSILAQDVNNLALNKSVTASSQQSGNEAPRLVDGDVNTRWSAEHYPQWVEVDLGENFAINRTEISPYLDRAYQYKIEISTDGTNYTEIVDRTSNTEGGSLFTDEFSSIDARYVKVTVTGAHGYTGGWASLTEFRVFGEKSIPKLDNVTLHLDSQHVSPGDQVSLSVSGLQTDENEADLSNASIKFESSQPEIVTFSDDETMTIADYVKDIRSFDVSVTVVLDEITVTSEPLSFTIDPTLEHTQELLREYVSSGEVKGPLVPQLTNTLKQVKHHQENENIEQATDHLNKFIKHVCDEAMQDHINNQVKEVFIQDLKKLIEILASSQNE